MAVHKRDGVDGNAGRPATYVVLYCGDTANDAPAAGDFMCIDTTTTTGVSPDGVGNSIKTSGVGTQDEGLICGISTQALAADGKIQIQVGGYYKDANVAGTVAAGDRLIASSTRGQAVEATTLTGTAAASFDYEVIAVALEADTSNVADVMIQNKGYWT